MSCFFLFSFCWFLVLIKSPLQLLNKQTPKLDAFQLIWPASLLFCTSSSWTVNIMTTILHPDSKRFSSGHLLHKRWNHSQINYQAQWPSPVLCDLSISLTITFTYPFRLTFFRHWQGSSYDKRGEIRDQVLICESHIWIRSEAAGRSGWRESWLELTWQLISDSMHPHPTA